jgi:hypothetical protein
MSLCTKGGRLVTIFIVGQLDEDIRQALSAWAECGSRRRRHHGPQSTLYQSLVADKVHWSGKVSGNLRKDVVENARE